MTINSLSITRWWAEGKETDLEVPLRRPRPVGSGEGERRERERGKTGYEPLTLHAVPYSGLCWGACSSRGPRGPTAPAPARPLASPPPPLAPSPPPPAAAAESSPRATSDPPLRRPAPGSSPREISAPPPGSPRGKPAPPPGRLPRSGHATARTRHLRSHGNARAALSPPGSRWPCWRRRRSTAPGTARGTVPAKPPGRWGGDPRSRRQRSLVSKKAPTAPRTAAGGGFRVQGSGFRVQGSVCRVQGSGFRVKG